MSVCLTNLDALSNHHVVDVVVGVGLAPNYELGPAGGELARPDGEVLEEEELRNLINDGRLRMIKNWESSVWSRVWNLGR